MPRSLQRMSFPRPHGTGLQTAAGWALTIGAAMAVVASSETAAADIYRSIDKDGVISFSNTPKSGAQLYVRTAEKPAPEFRASAPRDSSPERFSRYDQHIREAATLYQIPVELVRAVIKVESDFDPRATSRANARGLMQLIPETAERMMVRDSFDPRENIFGGTRYLRVLANMFNGDIQLTLASYNAGESAVMRYGGIPPYPETQDYVSRVLRFYRDYREVR